MIWMILLCEMPILRIVSGGKNIFRRNYSLPGAKNSNAKIRRYKYLCRKYM